MRCEEVRPLISAGLDGELETSSAARVRAHLADCAPCSAERQAVVETMQWLRALPEAEPPADLRRRIGTALLEVERTAGRRWLVFGLLARPRSAGWTWGAALGTAVATLFLVATHRPMPVKRMVAAPLAAPAPGTSLPRASVPVPGAGHPMPSALAVQPPAKLKQSLPAPPTPLPTASLPAPADVPTTVSLPVPEVQAPPVSSAHLATRKRVAARPLTVVRQTRPLAARPARLSPGATPPNAGSPPRPESVSEGSSLVARGDLTTPDAATVQEPSDDERDATSGMTQMASGDASAATVSSTSDDLAELRRRLTNRPLQAPELGAQKPTGSPRPGQSGWIRF